MMGGRGGLFGNDVAMVHSNHHGAFHDMLNTYGQHGAHNLSLWLTNAKEAAAKITEATRARQKEKEEKYSKFLRDLHSRVVVASKQQHLTRIPPARPYRLHHPQIEGGCNLGNAKHDNPTVREGPRDLTSTDLFKQVPRMDKVRVHLEKQLRKSSKSRHGISKLHRECMIQALMRQKAVEPLEEKACNIPNPRDEHCKSALPKEAACMAIKPFKRPSFVPVLPTASPQVRELVISEPCTPTGWNMIPMSFSALEMRSLESARSPTASETRETCTGDVNSRSSGVSTPEESLKHHDDGGSNDALLCPVRSQSSLSRFCRVGHIEMRGKENVRSNTSTGNWSDSDNTRGQTKEPSSQIVSGLGKRGQNQCEHSGIISISPSLGNEGVTTCPMGVVVLKGRDEYEVRGQGKQFFSDVWKCAMEVERRCAHERAHSLCMLQKKRMEQQKAEKRHKADQLREKSIAKQREAVQMQLNNVAILKARREGIVQRHRAVEKKRFSQALRAVRMDKTKGYGVQVPPLCNCGHGVHPLNANYMKKCHNDCPLRNNFLEYTLRLENALQQLLDNFNASSYTEDDLEWLSR